MMPFAVQLLAYHAWMSGAMPRVGWRYRIRQAFCKVCGRRRQPLLRVHRLRQRGGLRGGLLQDEQRARRRPPHQGATAYPAWGLKQGLADLFPDRLGYQTSCSAHQMLRWRGGMRATLDQVPLHAVFPPHNMSSLLPIASALLHGSYKLVLLIHAPTVKAADCGAALTLLVGITIRNIAGSVTPWTLTATASAGGLQPVCGASVEAVPAVRCEGRRCGGRRGGRCARRRPWRRCPGRRWRPRCRFSFYL